MYFYTCNTCVGYTPLSYDYCWDCNLIGWFLLNIKPYHWLKEKVGTKSGLQVWYLKSVTNAFTAMTSFQSRGVSHTHRFVCDRI